MACPILNFFQIKISQTIPTAALWGLISTNYEKFKYYKSYDKKITMLKLYHFRENEAIVMMFFM